MLVVALLALSLALLAIASRYMSNQTKGQVQQVPAWLLIGAFLALIAVNVAQAGTSLSGILSVADAGLMMCMLAWWFWPRGG
ncbi:MAG: hypothetical protein WD904_10435 [Dehalococcoidia bacterium]